MTSAASTSHEPTTDHSLFNHSSTDANTSNRRLPPQQQRNAANAADATSPLASVPSTTRRTTHQSVNRGGNYTAASSTSNTSTSNYLVKFDIDSKTLIALLQSLRFKLNSAQNRSDATDGTSSRLINGGYANEWICLELRTSGVIVSIPQNQTLSGFAAKAIMKQELFHTYRHPSSTNYLFQVKMGVLLDCIFLCASSSKTNDTMISMKYPGRENSLVISSFGSLNTNCAVRTKQSETMSIPRSEFSNTSAVSKLEIDAQALREALREILYWQQGIMVEIMPDKFILRTKNNDATAVQVTIESNAKAFFQYRCQPPGTKDEYSWEHISRCLQPLNSKAINKVQIATNSERMIRFRYFPTGDGEKNATVEYVLYPSEFDMEDDDDSMGDLE